MAIPEHFATEFSSNWMQRVQQTKARLEPYVDVETFMGEKKRYDRLASQTAHERTERLGPTVINSFTDDSRWAYRRQFELANLLDEADAKNMAPLALPDSALLASHAAAYNRSFDDYVIEKALGAVMTGENGTTSTAFSATYQIAHGGTGLTLAKLVTMNEILNGADLEDDAIRVLVVGQQQISNLLNETKIQSSDYNTIRALVAGQVDSFMGFKFVKNTRLTKVSTTRTCVCWVKGAIKAYKGAMNHKPSVRNDLSDATQLRSTWDFGAVRVYDEGVIQVDCTET
ncbi:hypothetical protein UFOVP672_28 [uncultured Caudovirales phage]|uniref:Major capsid protein n=1 Tax=uncultured Caudovirales phage TaxID=2100421 RepID=A0A6J5NDX2_9CAUD|nr:hypothetical protein UFOVP672_28 [uncultured Caudovirales phage]